MDRITCGIWGSIRNGRMQYRGVVECENRMTWRGKWRDSKVEAMREADKMAERVYDLNHNVLAVGGAIEPVHPVPGTGDAHRSH